MKLLAHAFYTHKMAHMKLLFIAPGNSLHTKRWIDRVAQSGVDCIFYDMESKESRILGAWPTTFELQLSRLSVGMIKVSQTLGYMGALFKDLLITWQHMRMIKKIIEVEKPDLIHIQWLYHPVALALSLIRNVPPIVATPWGSDLLTPEYKSKKVRLKKFRNLLVTRRIVKKSDSFCCDAKHMAQGLVFLGAEIENIHIIYFGTDINFFSPSKRKIEFWNSFGLSSESVKVISNRVLADMYDIETFIRAARIVSEKKAEVDFILVGGGPQSDQLKEYSKINGPTSGITFTGRLNDDDFSTATCSADIYVSTSPTDGGLAASVAEAMSAAIPVVITNFGDNSYWLKGQKAGLIFEPSDEIDLAAKIIRLLEDPTARALMGSTGRMIIEQENNSEIETQKVIRLYESLTS